MMECVLTGFVRPLSLPATVWRLMRRLLISVLTFVLDEPNIVCHLYLSWRRGWGMLASHHHCRAPPLYYTITYLLEARRLKMRPCSSLFSSWSTCSCPCRR
ncbi:unnamed protein product [Prorocentrum cordatum]|uniref:Secreted protein n=1 Tax=Prorocentrum cordatum TaxID=2364126 RepID=A0ABN9SAW1_9DINO|nr:unnamed protein product [Polarella glacialis]